MLGTAGLVALAVVTWLLGRSTGSADDPVVRRSTSASSYYLRNATLFGTDTDGRIYYRVNAREVEHFDGGRELRLTDLSMEYEPEADVRWRLTATAGRTSRELKVLDLSDGVELTNTEPPSGNETVIRTASLRLDTSSSLATTDDQISLLHGNMQFSATGLTADLSNDRLDLHSNGSAQLAH